MSRKERTAQALALDADALGELLATTDLAAREVNWLGVAEHVAQRARYPSPEADEWAMVADHIYEALEAFAYSETHRQCRIRVRVNAIYQRGPTDAPGIRSVRELSNLVTQDAPLTYRQAQELVGVAPGDMALDQLRAGRNMKIRLLSLQRLIDHGSVQEHELADLARRWVGMTTDLP